MGHGNELLEIVLRIESFFSKPIRSLDKSVLINIDTVRECAPWVGHIRE